MSFSSTATFSLIPIFHGLWVISHSRTLITESSPHCDSTTLSNLHRLRVCTRSCHSQLIDYIIVVRLTAWPFYLCPSSSGHNPDSALSLHRTFTIILFVLRDNSEFWDGILSMVIITFCFTIPLRNVVAVRLHSLETSRHNVSWSSLTFLASSGCQMNP